MFTNLHVHTTYSLLDGLSKVKDLIKFTKEIGQTSIAITDHGNMYGTIEFYQAAKKQGIKPILGEEFYVSANHLEKKPNDVRYHLILLAKNLEGYKNLIKLTSIANVDGFYYKPRIDFEVLKKYSKGLICSTACIQGEFPRTILSKDEKKLDKLIGEYTDLFGKENFFFEMQNLPAEKDQAIVNARLIELSKKHDIKCIATCDSHYLRKDDNEIQDILVCIQTKRLVTDTNRLSMREFDLSLKSEEEMLKLDAFKDFNEAVYNTQIIADSCNVELEMGVSKLPHYPLPEGITAEEEIRSLAKKYCPKKYGKEYDELDQSYKDRFDYELSVVKKMGYEYYFLIVQDYINWSKDNGILVGQGRGSAAGSIIAYLLNITDLDPIKYNLLFERFLNPDRISMPDVDTDFSDSRRDEVIKHAEEKYGKDHVSHIITFGTMASRASVKDVGRVLGVPYAFCDQLAKSIPQGEDIDEAMKSAPDFKELYDKNPDAKRIVDIAKKIEGGARNASVHACGILITKDPLDETTPVQLDEKTNTLVSQYSGHPAEDLGLLKMDFLGLKNLTILENATKIVEKIHGIKLNIDDIKPPDGYMNDENSNFTNKEICTFKLFQAADTTGVFQLESSGMKKYLKELKPTGFEDIIAMVALYRPGPMQFIPTYIARKNGKEKIVYDTPLMERALKNTYGITVYQEQVMQLSKDLADFTGGESDGLRKAIGKKIAALMAQYKDRFIEGGQKKGITKEITEKIWKEWEKFAEYCFNRSHAACYAAIAYQTAYIKANYPECFMAALLMSDSDDIDRIAIEIKDVKNTGIKVLPPDINESFKDFAVIKKEKKKSEKYDIRFGLSAIKNVGENIVMEIIKERKANGQYKSVEDFLQRIQTKDLNKKSLESLIKAGGFDSLCDRNILLTNLETLLNYNKSIKEEKNTKQVNIFAAMTKEGEKSLPNLVLQNAEEIDKKTKLLWEKELLGLYISDHPMEEFDKELENNVASLLDIREGKFKQALVAGVITTIKKISTKKNEMMAFVNIEDKYGQSLEVIIFPNLYKTCSGFIDKDRAIVAYGMTSDKDGEPKLLADLISELKLENAKDIIQKMKTDAVESRRKNDNRQKFINKNKPQITQKIETIDAASQKEEQKILNIKIKDTVSEEKIKELKKILNEHKGTEYKVCFLINDKKLETKFCVNLDKDITEKIKQILI